MCPDCLENTNTSEGIPRKRCVRRKILHSSEVHQKISEGADCSYESHISREPYEHGRYVRAEKAVGFSRNKYKTTTLQIESLSFPSNFRSELGCGRLFGYH